VILDNRAPIITLYHHPLQKGFFMDYSQEYVQNVLSNKQIAPPDRSRANGTYEGLVSLYDAHRAGGVEGARVAWDVIKTLRPELAKLEKYQYRARLINANDLQYLTAPIYLLDEYPIYVNGFNVIAGASGGGKSFVALDISGKIALNYGPVVYVAGEGLHGYNARWQAWKAYNRCDTERLWFYEEAVQVMDHHELTAFIELISQHKPLLVVIDTLARSAVGIEENSAREIGMFVRALDILRTTLNTSILVVHHTGKDGKIRGSSALYAAADSVISLTSEDNRITLRNDGDGGGKNKHAPAAKVRYLKILPYAVGDTQGAVLVEAEKMMQTEDDGLTLNQQMILDAVESSPMTAKELSDSCEIRISTCYRALAKLCELELITKLSDGRYAFGNVDESDVE
jgi:hypothetical protein